jgi:dienelactone hydrolase
MVTETAVQFGLNNSLIGVITRPEGVSQGPVCLLINAGLTPKSGPFRLYTQISRELAKSGFSSLRFDLDSIGDSGSTYSDKPLQERTLLQVAEAVRFTKQWLQPDSIYLGGLCSGAETALRYAAQDPAINGVLMIDPFAIATPAAEKHFFWHRLYRRFLRAVGLYQAEPGKPGLVDYQYIDHTEAHSLLKHLLERKSYLHFIYTSSVRERFNHPRQLQQAFPDLPINNHVEINWLPHVSHTPIFVYQQTDIVQTLCRSLIKNHFHKTPRLS